MKNDEHLIYLRKSRADVEAEARGEGETLARHERALLELSRRQDLNVTQIYREIVSGETIASRPVMQKLLTEVEQGAWAGVLVMEIERLARGDTMDQGLVSQVFKYSYTKIITPMKTYDPSNEFDEEYFEFGLFMSRREYKTINRRLQRGRIASVMEGKWVGNKTPYGYRRVKMEKEKGFTLEPDPDEAPIVRLIYELYTIGEEKPAGSWRRLGVSLIVRRLNDMLIPSRTGDKWVIATIQGILHNPVYIGKIRWNNRPQVKQMVNGQMTQMRPRAKDCIVVDGLHNGIIDKSTFELAQKYLSVNPPRPVPGKKETKNPLCGIVVCGKCGRKMVRRPYPAHKNSDSLICQVTSCNNVSSYLHIVERRLLEALSDWLRDYKLQWEINKPTVQSSVPAIQQKALSKVREDLKKLEMQRGNLHDLLEQGVYDTETFLDRSRELGERIAQTQAETSRLENEIQEEEDRKESRKEIIPKVEHVLEVYHELPTAAAKNDLLKEVLEKVVYKKDLAARHGGAEDKFDLVLYPRLPRKTLS